MNPRGYVLDTMFCRSLLSTTFLSLGLRACSTTYAVLVAPSTYPWATLSGDSNGEGERVGGHMRRKASGTVAGESSIRSLMFGKCGSGIVLVKQLHRPQKCAHEDVGGWVCPSAWTGGRVMEARWLPSASL